jgi:hypothetical protein
MFGFLAYFVAILATVLAFFSPLWAWLPILQSVRSGYRAEYVPELSAAANKLLQQFTHFYGAPFAGASFSSAASTMALAGVAVAVIGAIKGFWWAVAIAAANYFVISYIAWQFNPVRVLNADDRSAHEEVATYLREHSDHASNPISRTR